MGDITLCFIHGCSCSNHHNSKPRYTKGCSRGIWCNRPNCYFTHPPDRILPPHDPTPCTASSLCSNPWCNLVHPERTIIPYVPRHTPPILSPRPCRHGKTCQIPFCPYDHRLLNELCTAVGPCIRGQSCWYAHHNVYMGVLYGGGTSITAPYREELYR